MATRTQGPWRAGKTGGAVVADYPIPEVDGSGHVEYYGGHLVAESIAPQNIPLIAAAPDLLAALKTLVTIPEVRQEDMQAARAAIAKAESRP